jgi:uncharacterized protein YdhG (YjbR/CyaY superfamily)
METVAAYIEQLPAERQEVIEKLRKVIKKHLPKGFEECISYKMIGYVVPKKTYPDGYHCDPTLPLPFLSIGSQKNFVAIYHMGIYADPKLLAWFQEQYATHCTSKLDMGKSCIRFKKMADIPYPLIGELVSKMTIQDWIAMYEKNYKP